MQTHATETNLCHIRRHGDRGGKLTLRDTGCQDLVRRRQLSELNARLGAPTIRLATMPGIIVLQCARITAWNLPVDYHIDACAAPPAQLVLLRAP
jgi:hypothetical protein